MKTLVIIFNFIGFNWLSRFITGHVGTGILVLLLDVLSLATLSIGIGWIGIIIGCIIWVVDLVTVCTNKWRMGDGTYLMWASDTVNNPDSKSNIMGKNEPSSGKKYPSATGYDYGPSYDYGATWTCRKCGDKNPKNNSFCKGCGEYK